MNRRHFLQSALLLFSARFGNSDTLDEKLKGALRLGPRATEFQIEETFRDCCQNLLQQEKFQQLGLFFQELRKRRILDPSGLWLLGAAYKGVRNVGERNHEDQVALCRRWAKALPKDNSAQVVLAEALTRFAWEIRGGGYANTVNEKSWKIFRQTLEEADSLLRAAAHSSDRDCYTFAKRISVSMGLQQAPKQTRAIFEQALTFGPSHSIQPYSAYARSLLTRWGGRSGQVASLAKEAESLNRKRLGQGGYAFVMMHFGEKEFAREADFDWPHCRRALEDLVERFPRSRTYLQEYLPLAHYYQDREALRSLARRNAQGKIGEGLTPQERNSHFSSSDLW